jgi:hypothetical protein
MRQTIGNACAFCGRSFFEQAFFRQQTLRHHGHQQTTD